MLRSTRSRAVVALAGSAIAAAGMVAPVSAHAATARNGVCEAGEFCFSFNSGFQGSVSDFTKSLDYYSYGQPWCYEFRGKGDGQGRCIVDDEASVWNRMRYSVRIFTGRDYTGRSMDIKPGARLTLPAGFKNNIKSHLVLTPLPPCRPYRACAQ